MSSPGKPTKQSHREWTYGHGDDTVLDQDADEQKIRNALARIGREDEFARLLEKVRRKLPEPSLWVPPRLQPKPAARVPRTRKASSKNAVTAHNRNDFTGEITQCG